MVIPIGDFYLQRLLIIENTKKASVKIWNRMHIRPTNRKIRLENPTINPLYHTL